MILEEICASGGNAGACHAQMYVMGTLLRHGSEEQKRAVAARRSPPASCGCRRSASPSRRSARTLRSIKTRAVAIADGWIVSGQKIWTSRAEHSDLMVLLARTTPLEQVEKRTDGLSVFLVDMRERGPELRDPTDQDDDEPRDHRGVLQRAAPARQAL